MQQELQREKEANLRSEQHEKSTQTEKIERNESGTPTLGDHAVKSQDRAILQEILYSLHGDYSSSLQKAVFAAQTNDMDDISSLRAVINQRLGEEWSLVILENARMKSELNNIRGRINEEKRSFESELTKSKLEEEKEGEAAFQEDEVPNQARDQKVLEIMIYDQNKVIAKLEMDKLELVKGLQRYKAPLNQLQSDVDVTFDETCDLKQEDSLTKDDLDIIVREKLHELSAVHQENESLKAELDSLRSKYNSLGKENNNSSEPGQKLVNSLNEIETSVTPQMNEKCTELEENLAVSTKENNKLKEKLTELEDELCKIQQERDAITEQNIALEKRMREQQDNIESALALEREQKANFEQQLQSKTREFEEGKTLLKLKENCLSKVEAELAETKESYEKLMKERLNEYELEKDIMIKEINGLRCLQGLPTLKLDSNRGSVTPRQEEKGGLVSAEKHSQNRRNNKLNSELTRAKEQLVRLKAELTMSNMQTRNLGTQLTSLREDSTKLEAELSTVRGFPKNSGQRRNSISCYDETVRLEIELAEAKEKIIDLQEKLLSIYKEKFALEEKIMSLEGQRNTDAENSEKLCSTNPDHELDSDLQQTKGLELKINLLEAEREQLKKDLENTNSDRSRLEGIELCVQQLVSLEDEQLRLKSRLKKWAQNSADKQCLTEAISTDKIVENSHLNQLRELSAENCSLQVEANTLKEKIAELESDLEALKLKVSIKDVTQEATADKKAVATLLVAVKQERAELQEALKDVLITKEDLEEELSEIKMKYARLQREFAMISIIKDDLELEVLSLKRANLTRGLSNLTQSSEECRSEISDCCADELMVLGVNGVDVSTGKKIASPAGGKKKTNGVSNRKAAPTTRNHRESQSASSSGTTKSSSKSKAVRGS